MPIRSSAEFTLSDRPGDNPNDIPNRIGISFGDKDRCSRDERSQREENKHPIDLARTPRSRGQRGRFGGAGWLSRPHTAADSDTDANAALPGPDRYSHAAADRDGEPHVPAADARAHAQTVDRYRPRRRRLPRPSPLRRRPHRRPRSRPARRPSSACSSRATTRASSTCCGRAMWRW